MHLRTVERQTSAQLSYLRKDRLFYFRATDTNKSRSYTYVASVNQTSAKVVSAYANKGNPKGHGYVHHHAARLRFERLQIQVEDKLVNVAPGMAVTVEIKTGSRRIISYLLSPLLKYKQEALRER